LAGIAQWQSSHQNIFLKNIQKLTVKYQPVLCSHGWHEKVAVVQISFFISAYPHIIISHALNVENISGRRGASNAASKRTVAAITLAMAKIVRNKSSTLS